MLAAYLEKHKNKKILLIDLDYQGSLTKWMIQIGGIYIPPDQAHRLSYANNLLDGSALKNWRTEVLANNHMEDLFSQAELITADYTLTQRETALMLSFFANCGTPDIRFNIAEVLLSEKVQGTRDEKAPRFDVVLIDAPPRLTAGVVSALIASTHLIVPTILDPLAAETVASFLRQTWALREKFNMGLELAGVLPTMTPARPLASPLGEFEKSALGIVQGALAEWPSDPYIFKRDIQERAAIRNIAGRRMPYFADDLTRQMVNEFGAELCQRIKL